MNRENNIPVPVKETFSNKSNTQNEEVPKTNTTRIVSPDEVPRRDGPGGEESE